jgi:hypothetical protein
MGLCLKRARPGPKPTASRRRHNQSVSLYKALTTDSPRPWRSTPGLRSRQSSLFFLPRWTAPMPHTCHAYRTSSVRISDTASSRGIARPGNAVPTRPALRLMVLDSNHGRPGP